MFSAWTFINPWFYSKVYVAIIAVITVIFIFKYNSKAPQFLNESLIKFNLFPSLSFAILVTFFIGFRPLSGAFTDMMNYSGTYQIVADMGDAFYGDDDVDNPIFNKILLYFASNAYEIIIFFFVIACIYVGCIYWTIHKIFPKDLFYAFIIYLGAFSTFSYGTNGIKAGAAASIFLLAFAYYKKPLIAALFCLLSLGFHHSMIVVIYAFVIAYFIKNPKWYFYGWLICLILAAMHITIFQQIFADFAKDESANRYLLGNEYDWGGRAGFRIDFILYSLPPIALAWWATYKYKIKDRLYQLLFCTYLTTNAVWMLCMYMPYNNRLAYLSWFMLPILICYPFFKFKLYPTQYKTLNLIVGVYLAFTVFTTFGGLI